MAGRFSVDAIFRAIDKMTAPIAKMQSSLERFSKSASAGMKGLDTAADKWLGTLGKVATGLGVVGAGVAAAAYNVGKSGADFEQAITNVGAVSLMTRAQVKDLELEARKLGMTTKYSATQVAAGMETMGKAGFTNAQIIKTIGPVLSAAAAEGADFDEVAGNISNTLKGMGMYVDDTDQLAVNTAKVADVLALASARTNSSMSSLGESMKNLAPIARQFNIPFESAVASVALLQDVGIDASEAGTSMGTMLTKLATPTDAIKAKMRQLGVTFQNAEGNMLSLPEVFANFSTAAKKSGGNMKQAAFFAELLGLRGQRAGLNMQKLFQEGKFDALVKELTEAKGKAEEMAAIRMDTFGGDLTKLGNVVEDLKIQLFDTQSGPLRDIIKSMNEWLTANKDIIAQDFAGFIKRIADNMESFITWGRRIGTVIAVFTAASLAVKLLAGAVQLLTWALAANPISLIAIAIVGAIALILAFWPEISAFFSAMWDGIVEIAESVGSVFADIGSAIADGVSAIFGPIFDLYMAYWTAVAEFVVGVFVIAFNYVSSVLKPVFDWIEPYFRAVMDFVLGYWTSIWDAAMSVLQAGFDNIVWVVETSFHAIGDIASFWFGVVSAVWGGLVTVFSAVWDGIKWAFERTLGPVFDKLAWAVEKIREVGRFALGSDDEAAPASDGANMSVAPQVVSPGERVAQSISESTTTNQSEVTIKDQTGRAVVTKKPARGGAPLRLAPSGGFH